MEVVSEGAAGSADLVEGRILKVMGEGLPEERDLRRICEPPWDWEKFSKLRRANRGDCMPGLLSSDTAAAVRRSRVDGAFTATFDLTEP